MMSFKAVQKQFLKHCQYSKSLSDHTVRAYTQDLEDFRRFLGRPTTVEGITAQQVESYIQDLLGRRSLSPATAKRRLGCLKVFYAWANAAGHITTNPLRNFSIAIKLPRRLPRTITRDELRKILKATSTTTRGIKDSQVVGKPVMHLGILLMASTGMRVAELLAIKLSDVDAEHGLVLIHGKGDRERTVFITDDGLRRKLQAQMQKRRRLNDASDRLLTTGSDRDITPSLFRSHLRRIVKTAGVARRITPHMLRHTAATLLIEEGVDIRFVQRLLGHQSISTTEIYTHVTDMNLRTALARADLIRSVSNGGR